MLGVFSIFGEKASRLSLFSRATKIGGPPLRTYPVEKLLPTVRPSPPILTPALFVEDNGLAAAATR